MNAEFNRPSYVTSFLDEGRNCFRHMSCGTVANLQRIHLAENTTRKQPALTATPELAGVKKPALKFTLLDSPRTTQHSRERRVGEKRHRLPVPIPVLSYR